MKPISDFIPPTPIEWLNYVAALPNENGAEKLRTVTKRKCFDLTARYALVILAAQAYTDRYAATPTARQISNLLGTEVHTSTYLELREKGWITEIPPQKGSKRKRFSVVAEKLTEVRAIETSLMEMIEKLKQKNYQ